MSKPLPKKLRAKWDALVATEGTALGLSDCRVFLENKMVNDIFYEGLFKDRPCIVKCSSRAPDSIRNEYEMSKRLFVVAPVCAEPLAHYATPDGKMAFVVTEKLAGPSLAQLRRDPERLKRLVDVIADDFVRISRALLAAGIVHGDAGTCDNLMMGDDGHLRLIDFQFALDRTGGCTDRWLLAHVKYRLVVLSCRLSHGVARWNDIAFFRDHLILRMPVTDKSKVTASELAAMVEEGDYKEIVSPRDRFILRLYLISLGIQRFFKPDKSALAERIRRLIPLFEGHFPRTRKMMARNQPDAGVLPEKSVFEALRGEKIMVAPPVGSIPCRETSDAERLCRNPVVSVVMTVYNHRKFIERAVEGVVTQKADFEYELLICEDCSPDGSRDACFELQRKYPDKIRVLWSEDNVSRCGGNCRRGLARCRGEFVALCEGDDYWTATDKLSKQVALMRAHPSAGLCLAGTNYYSEAEQRVVLSFEPKCVSAELMKGMNVAKRVIFGSAVSRGFYGPARHTSTFLYRREVAERASRKFPEIRNWIWRCGDTSQIALLGAVSDVCFLREQVSVYRLNSTGITRRNPGALMRDAFVFNVLAAVSLFGMSYAEALSFFADKIVWSWVQCARRRADGGGNDICSAISSSTDLAGLFSRWHCRPLMWCLRRRSMRGVAFAMAGLLFKTVASVRKAANRGICE